jgi:hypothetical protein
MQGVGIVLGIVPTENASSQSSASQEVKLVVTVFRTFSVPDARAT